MKERRNRALVRSLLLLTLALAVILAALCLPLPLSKSVPQAAGAQLVLARRFDLDAFLRDPPVYAGEVVVEVNGNRPLFTEEEIAQPPDVTYSPLDALGRCGPAMGRLGPETVPREKRGPIGDVRPSGWHTVRYDDRIEDRYLYNRCHLIGYQLAGNNAEANNLITGTRYMNMSGMLPYENRVSAYIAETGGHVLYRVRPVFLADDLLASGVLMEAYSLEDRGQGLSFCVYVHNVQPGVVIDYRTGESWAEEDWPGGAPAAALSGATAEAAAAPTPGPAEVPADDAQDPQPEVTYILNTNTKRFHYPSCPSVQETKEKNKQPFCGTREEAIQLGYIPCGRCKP